MIRKLALLPCAWVLLAAMLPISGWQIEGIPAETPLPDQFIRVALPGQVRQELDLERYPPQSFERQGDSYVSEDAVYRFFPLKAFVMAAYIPTVLTKDASSYILEISPPGSTSGTRHVVLARITDQKLDLHDLGRGTPQDQAQLKSLIGKAVPGAMLELTEHGYLFSNEDELHAAVAGAASNRRSSSMDFPRPEISCCGQGRSEGLLVGLERLEEIPDGRQKLDAILAAMAEINASYKNESISLKDYSDLQALAYWMATPSAIAGRTEILDRLSSIPPGLEGLRQLGNLQDEHLRYVERLSRVFGHWQDRGPNERPLGTLYEEMLESDVVKAEYQELLRPDPPGFPNADPFHFYHERATYYLDISVLEGPRASPEFANPIVDRVHRVQMELTPFRDGAGRRPAGAPSGRDMFAAVMKSVNRVNAAGSLLYDACARQVPDGSIAEAACAVYRFAKANPESPGGPRAWLTEFEAGDCQITEDAQVYLCDYSFQFTSNNKLMQMVRLLPEALTREHQQRLFRKEPWGWELAS